MMTYMYIEFLHMEIVQITLLPLLFAIMACGRWLHQLPAQASHPKWIQDYLLTSNLSNIF